MKPTLTSVPTNLPEPPYPADTHVKGFQFRIDHERLFSSDTWALAPPDVRPWLLMLWHTAWTQRPAGAFTNDHAVIAAKIGMDPRQFAAHADILLRGFVLHSDGRLYHPVVVEQVLRAGKWKDDTARRQAEYRKRKKAEQESNALVTRYSRVTNVTATTPEPEPEPGPGPKRKESPSDSCRASPTRRDAEAVLDYLNERAGTRYQPVRANLDRITARLREYDVETLRGVIDRKTEQWGSDDKMRQFLRPATLFGAEKCAQYVGESTVRASDPYTAWLEQRRTIDQPAERLAPDER